jgi:hypothetical protein
MNQRPESIGQQAISIPYSSGREQSLRGKEKARKKLNNMLDNDRRRS